MALRVAESVDAEIINADALQVYKGLRILTARPSESDMAAVPHHLYGTVEPTTRHSTGAWARDAVQAIEEIAARGKRALLVGGTGLYFKALFDGLAEVPEPGEAARAEAEAVLARGMEHLRAEAQRLDPHAAARVQGDDPQRLLRILSVALGTGRPLSDWQKDTRPLVHDWAGVVVEVPRAELYARINARFARMVERGALEEAEALAHLDPVLPAAKAIGLPQLLDYLRGETTLDTAMKTAQRESRRLAKRQGTWFRGQAGDWPRVTKRCRAASGAAIFGNAENSGGTGRTSARTGSSGEG